jgi:hypothetical protein
MTQDPLFDEEPQGLISRLLPPLVLICAFGGFIALAIYAYKAGTQSVNDGDLMVIEADATPMKEKPEDPGGMQFPNQDKTVFETFSAGNEPPKVERVLPTPEEPLPPAKEASDSEPTTWVNGKLKTAAPAAPSEKQGAEQVFGEAEALPVKEAEPEAKPAAQVKNVQEELGKQAVGEVPVAEVAKPVELAPKEPAKPVAKPAEKPKAATGGKGLVQLGAYKSEAEAKGDFARIQKKYAALAGKTPTINRADLGDKGIFFRLRVASDDAKGLCSSLSASGQACMVVK